MDDVEADGSVFWLDMKVSPEGMHARIQAKLEDVDWLEGRQSAPSKWRMPPGDAPAAGTDELFSLASGHTARLLTMGLAEKELKEAVQHQLSLWSAYGYDLVTIKHVWMKCGKIVAKIVLHWFYFARIADDKKQMY